MAISMACLAAMNGCATPISVAENYNFLDRDAKVLFLDAYPDLTSEKKLEYLERPETLRPTDSHNSQSRAPLSLRKPVSLQIDWLPSQEVTTGNVIELRAYVNYSDGNKIDATPDVTWKATPPIVSLDTNKLLYECVDSDISVSASFLDEVHATQTFKFRKSLNSIAVRVAELSSIIDNSAFIKLNSNAICQDGTVTEVSCQTIWKVDPQWGSFQGCGHLVPSPKSWKEGSAEVSVSYGTLNVTTTVLLPARAPRR
ncbi:MAG: hypothetical protein ABIQ95_11735 [Bdellovibrionia bacterium]